MTLKDRAFRSRDLDLRRRGELTLRARWAGRTPSDRPLASWAVYRIHCNYIHNINPGARDRSPAALASRGIGTVSRTSSPLILYNEYMIRLGVETSNCDDIYTVPSYAYSSRGIYIRRINSIICNISIICHISLIRLRVSLSSVHTCI